MQQTTASVMPSTTLLVEVSVAPELAEIHGTFGPLLRLSELGAAARAASATSVSVNGGGVSPSEFSGNGDDANNNNEACGRRSPAMSPMRAAESKLVELTAPVTVALPPPLSTEDSAFIAQYVRSFRAHEAVEKAYVAFIFQEYKKRKSLELKWSNELEAMRAELETLRQKELPPEVRAAVEDLMRNEAKSREAVEAAYHAFLDWVESMIPQWTEAAQRQEQQRLENEKAKKAAMAAAREALAQELAMGKQLGGLSSSGAAAVGASAVAGGRPRMGSLSGAAGTAKEQGGNPSYEPSVSVEEHLQASHETSNALTPSELRRKAIRMLEAEEEEMKRRREDQVRLLRVHEEQLREGIALKKKHDEEAAARKERETAQKREDEIAQRYNALLEQEFALQQRIREKTEAEAKKAEERRLQMERVAAEEQLLRQRLKEKEDRRKASEEETARVAREKHLREVREQEEALRRRIAERTAAAEAAKREREAQERQVAEAAAVRAQQEEALRNAQAQRERTEKQRQLAFLREQEEVYKRHLREKELAEIEAKRREAEAHWSHSNINPTVQQGNSYAGSSSHDPTPGSSTAPMRIPSAAAAPQMNSAYAASQPQPSPSGFYPYAASAPFVVPPAQPPPPPLPQMPQQQAAPYPQPSYYGAYPNVPLAQPPMMPMMGQIPYPGNPAVYYSGNSTPGMMAPQPSPYASAAMYQR